MPIYAYCRATKSLPLEEQYRLIGEQAMRNGWTIDTTSIEVNSRIIPLRGRKQGKRLLRLLQTGDTIIAAQFFSLFGSQPEASDIIRDLQQRGISLWVLDIGGEFNDDKLVGFPLRVLFRARELEGFSASRIRAGKAKLRAEASIRAEPAHSAGRSVRTAPSSLIQSSRPPLGGFASCTPRADHTGTSQASSEIPASRFPIRPYGVSLSEPPKTTLN
jgi:Resolvase, N terminal domain